MFIYKYILFDVLIYFFAIKNISPFKMKMKCRGGLKVVSQTIVLTRTWLGK